jgi:hypothetical protein
MLLRNNAKLLKERIGQINAWMNKGTTLQEEWKEDMFVLLQVTPQKQEEIQDDLVSATINNPSCLSVHK